MALYSLSNRCQKFEVAAKKQTVAPLSLTTRRASFKARTVEIAADVVGETGVDADRVVVATGDTVGLVVRAVVNAVVRQVRVTIRKSLVYILYSEIQKDAWISL